MSAGLAVFMPCFMAHQPAGVQIYLATSFVFTMFQSAALRNDNIRAFFGLPSLDVQRQQKIGAVTKEFVDIKEFEKEAKEAARLAALDPVKEAEKAAKKEQSAANKILREQKAEARRVAQLRKEAVKAAKLEKETKKTEKTQPKKVTKKTTKKASSGGGLRV